ncbi:MAG: tetratricopeptide repeat protein [Candidatus Heimdallarchaeota archaeon]
MTKGEEGLVTSFEQVEQTIQRAREKWVAGFYAEANKLLMTLLESNESERAQTLAYLELGHIAIDCSKEAKAFEFYQSAQALAARHDDDNRKTWALLGLAAVAHGTGKLKKGLHFATSALDHFRNSSGDDLGFFEATRQHALHYLIVGDYEKSQDYLRVVIDGLESTENLGILGKVYLARAWNLLGALHLYTGNHKASLEVCAKSYGVASEATEQGYRSGMGLAAINMGEGHRHLGEYNKALTYYEEALGILKELGADVDTATALQNIALVYSTRGEYQQAAAYFEQSKLLYEVHGRISDQILLLGDMAGHMHVRGDFKAAAQLFEESIQLYRAVGSEEELVDKLCRFAATLMELGEFARAENLLQEAERLANKHASHSETLHCQLRFGILEKARSNFGSARQLLLTTLQDAETRSLPRFIISSSLALAEIALRDYQASCKPPFLRQASELVTKATVLAQDQHLLPIVGETLLLQALFALEELNYEAAHAQLIQASLVAEESGLRLLQQRIAPHLHRLNRVRDRERHAALQMTEQERTSCSMNEAIEYIQICQRVLDVQEIEETA